MKPHLEYLPLEQEQLDERWRVLYGLLHQGESARKVAQVVVVLGQEVEHPQLGRGGLADGVGFL